MIGEGLTDAQIAARLSRAESTIRYDIRAMKAHLNVCRREILVRYAVRIGLVPV
jgi:DNA-binding CsgD family transcriptional regulator